MRKKVVYGALIIECAALQSFCV